MNRFSYVRCVSNVAHQPYLGAKARGDMTSTIRSMRGKDMARGEQPRHVSCNRQMKCIMQDRRLSRSTTENGVAIASELPCCQPRVAVVISIVADCPDHHIRIGMQATAIAFQSSPEKIFLVYLVSKTGKVFLVLPSQDPRSSSMHNGLRIRCCDSMNVACK